MHRELLLEGHYHTNIHKNSTQTQWPVQRLHFITRQWHVATSSVPPSLGHPHHANTNQSHQCKIQRTKHLMELGGTTGILTVVVGKVGQKPWAICYLRHFKSHQEHKITLWIGVIISFILDIHTIDVNPHLPRIFTPVRQRPYCSTRYTLHQWDNTSMKLNQWTILAIQKVIPSH